MVKTINTVRGLFTAMLLLMVLTFIGVVVFGVSLHKQSNHDYLQLSKEFSKKLSAAYSLEKQFLLQGQEWKFILLRGQDSKQYHKHLKQFYIIERSIRKAIADLKKGLIVGSRQYSLLSQFEKDFRQLGKDYRRAIRAYNEAVESPHIIADRYTEHSKLLEELIGDFVIAMNAWREVEIAEINAKESEDQTKILIALVLLVVLSTVVVLMVMQRKIVRPIDQATLLANHIARGNLNTSTGFTEGTTEISQLLDSLEIMQTNIRESQSALISERENAQQANHAKSEFLSSMSHELRTPMNAILGFGQMLELDATLTPRNQRFVSEILKAGSHLLELINEVLDLAKIEEGKLIVDIENVSIIEIITESLTLLASQASQRNIELVNNARDNDYFIRADRLRVKQVFINMLSNAIKYNIENGSVKVDVELLEGEKVRVSVTDTGPGIAADKLNKLFVPFERLGFEGDVVEGTGIGLSLCKRLLDLMNGHIDVRCDVGQGCTFFFELPFAGKHSDLKSTSSSVVSARYEDVTQDDASLRYSLLYVEDNPSSQRLMSEYIRDTRPDIDLVVAHNGVIGLDLTFSRTFDLILLDINLPGLDGRKILAKIISDERTGHIPVIAISANAMPADIKNGLAAGFSEYLVKPIDISKLKAVLNQYLPTSR